MQANIVVGLESPYHVLRSDSGLQALLDFAPEDVYGRSIRFLQGPRTDCGELHGAIKNAASKKSTTIHVVLYGRSGQCRNIIVSCSPFNDSCNALMGCLITLEKSDAVTIKDALESNTCAKALISAEQPHIIHQINDEFTELFGFTQGQMIGRSLRTVHGPRTESNRWSSLLERAAIGRSTTDIITTCGSSGMEMQTTISCVPVMEPLSTKIGSMLIFFSKLADCPSPKAAAKTQETPQQPPSSPEQQHAAHQSIPDHECSATRPPSSSPPEDDNSGHLSDTSYPICDAPCPIIARRRKAGDDTDGRKAPPPISITLPLLESLADLTLIAAARKIRVSTTALKKACRKLGVDRWPYRKDPGGRLAPRDFDEGYVRRLHRKYGSARSGLKHRAAMPMVGDTNGQYFVCSPQPEDDLVHHRAASCGPPPAGCGPPATPPFAAPPAAIKLSPDGEREALAAGGYGSEAVPQSHVTQGLLSTFNGGQPPPPQGSWGNLGPAAGGGGRGGGGDVEAWDALFASVTAPPPWPAPAAGGGDGGDEMDNAAWGQYGDGSGGQWCEVSHRPPPRPPPLAEACGWDGLC